MHEIHTYSIINNFVGNFLSFHVKYKDILSFMLFGSETNYYNMEVKGFIFANFTSKYRPFHFILSHL